MHPPRLLFLVLAFVVSSATAQIKHGPLSFGVEFGLLSNVRVAYSPWSQFEIQFGAGSALPNNDSYLETVSASLTYVFSDQPTTAILRLSGYATNIPGTNGITSIEAGVRHYLSDSISSYAFLGPGFEYESFDRPVFTLTGGVGVSIHLP